MRNDYLFIAACYIIAIVVGVYLLLLAEAVAPRLGVSVAHGDVIVSVTEEDRFLGREVVTPDCAWIDNFAHVTTTIFAVGDNGDIGSGLYWHPDSFGVSAADYPGYANPCFVKEGWHPAFWDMEEGYCAPAEGPNAGSATVNFISGGEETRTDIMVTEFSTTTDFCKGKDCHGHPKEVVVSEPTGLCFWGIGLIGVGRLLRKWCPS